MRRPRASPQRDGNRPKVAWQEFLNEGEMTHRLSAAETERLYADNDVHRARLAALPVVDVGNFIDLHRNVRCFLRCQSDQRRLVRAAIASAAADRPSRYARQGGALVFLGALAVGRGLGRVEQFDQRTQALGRRRRQHRQHLAVDRGERSLAGPGQPVSGHLGILSIVRR
jgi:hypothetical protein